MTAAFRTAAITTKRKICQSHHGETGSQPKALAAAIVAYARNIDNLGALASRWQLRSAPGGAARDLEQRVAGWKGLLQLPINLLFDCFPITLLASSGILGHDATSTWPTRSWCEQAPEGPGSRLLLLATLD